MRILFCFVGGPGHFEPMVPIARSAQLAGHTVAVACGPSLVPVVKAAGFPALGIGPSARTTGPKRLPLQEVDIAREEQDLRERFADRAARLRARGVLLLATSWCPDVIVADEVDFGSTVAAEVLGIPYATVLVIAAGTLVRQAVVADTLELLRSEHGLPPDPDFTAPSRYLVLSPFPPSLRDPTAPLPATTHLFRPVDIHRGDDAAPPWPRHLAGAPCIYFTLGTEFNLESGDLFTRVLAGLRELPINVLATVGRQIDPGELGPQPANVRVERYVRQEEALSGCDLVVFHGGSGTLTGALAHGVPMVILAMGADQPANALRCQALGVGVTLDPLRATPAAVRESVTLALGDPAYRHAARQLGREIAAQPEPATAVALLERLAVERRPLPGRGSLS
ncbi:MAG: glycosyltransferase [Candidatus Dormibacteria bacterium]